MEFNDFRVVSSNTAYRKTSTGSLVTSGQSTGRYRYALGEVSSTNIVLDVNVGTGWTRIRLKEVPKFIVHAFNMITKFGMEVDGIFRKEGNSARLNRAEVQNIYNGLCDIPNDYTVIDVCTLVKRFLRDLKPPLLNSEDFRTRLLKKACQARISDNYELTRDEMADMCYAEAKSKETQMPLLADINFSTLGYVMRQLNRISAHCDQHKMSIENLAVVLVGSVFGDRVHDPKKSGQIRRGSQDDILAQKKQDMNVHVAAVKLLITNANLIGIQRDPYVTSNAMLRSSSAMPTMRCMSSGYETASSDADNTSTTASTVKSRDQNENSTPSTYRRDSEAAHKIVTARKKGEDSSKKKRSASFLPSFRDIRTRFAFKRAKTPSPDRLISGHSIESKADTLSSTDQTSEPIDSGVPARYQAKVSRNESNTLSTGSTASGRQSRSQQSRRGNTNAAPKSSGSDNSRNNKPNIAKHFDEIQYVSKGPLRRLSQSDQNAEIINKLTKVVASNEKISANEYFMSEYIKSQSRTTRSTRNTVVLGETDSSSSNTRRKNVNRRHTAPVNNNGLRRNRPNTVGAGLPQRRATLLGTASVDEKENQINSETDESLDQTVVDVESSKALLEKRAIEARLRRANKKQRVKNVPNGNSEATLNSPSPSLPVDSKTPPNVVLRKDLEEKKRIFCDIATSPMIFDSGMSPSSSKVHENGHVWVGTKQIVSVASPTLIRRQSRTRLSYSKATESPIDMPYSTKRDSSPLVSPILKHSAQINNSPELVITTTIPRTSLTPKTQILSPLVIKKTGSASTSSIPPPVPPHSPPQFTPQLSKASLLISPTADKRSASTEKRNRPPTPPSNPKLSNHFSPKLPIRSVTVDCDPCIELRPMPVSPAFKLPQLPMRRGPGPVSPLSRQPQSMMSLSASGRPCLRESRSTDAEDAMMMPPPKTAPLLSSYHGELSPRSNEFFGFGKYTNIIRSSKDELNLPTRRQSVESRPSVAIIRANNCGLVRSRVNHFQEIEQSTRNETAMSGRLSALSQLSLKSSSSDRFSDVSERATGGVDARMSLPSESVSMPTMRTSYDPVHRF